MTRRPDRLREQTGRALLDCVAERPVRFDGVDPSALTELARRHRVTGYVGCAARASGVSIPGLVQDVHQHVAQHLRALASLRELAPALDASGIAWVAVKGPVLSEYVHARHGLRAYHDLDLVVAAADLPAAVEVLECAGCQLLERNHGLMLRRLPGEVHLRTRHAVVVDLHWTLVNQQHTRAVFRVPVEEILSRRVWVDISGRLVPTTDPEDTLLHVGLHAALAGGDRLVWLKDIDQILRNLDLDAETLRTRSRLWGGGPACALMAARAARALGTPLPLDLAGVLAPGVVWRGFDAVADRGWVAPPLRDRSALARVVAKSTRPGAAGRAWALARRLVRALRRRLIGDRKAATESVFDDRPDPVALQEYFRVVAS